MKLKKFLSETKMQAAKRDYGIYKQEKRFGTIWTANILVVGQLRGVEGIGRKNESYIRVWNSWSVAPKK